MRDWKNALTVVMNEGFLGPFFFELLPFDADVDDALAYRSQMAKIESRGNAKWPLCTHTSIVRSDAAHAK